MTLFSNNQIDVALLPKSEDLELNPISPKYFTIILLNTVLFYSIFILALIGLYVFSDDVDFKTVFWYLVVVICAFFTATIFIYYIGFKKRKYAIREKDITFSHGYIVNKTITLPYNRIQHIEIKRSFLARKFGLSTLKLYSAGQAGGDISIKGLPKDIAETQYAFLTEIINERV
jgi:membrane protein YdbS with pleckstrin-like domain